MVGRALAHFHHHPMNDAHFLYVEKNSAWTWSIEPDPVTRND
jgi:hypothetical protein